MRRIMTTNTTTSTLLGKGAMNLDTESSDEPILFVGDVHGNQKFMHKTIKKAVKAGVKWIIQLGDFGLWIDSKKLNVQKNGIIRGTPELNVGYLNSLNEFLVQHDVNMIFIDGNHDNHPQAREIYSQETSGLRNIGSNLTWADRGSVFTLHGIKFGALGGAVSIDKANRIPNISWWETEAITLFEITELIDRAGDSVDVLLSHDAPSFVQIPGIELYSGGEMTERIVSNRNKLEWACLEIMPKTLIHGHYHIGYSTLEGFLDPPVRVIGLSADCIGDEWASVFLTREGLLGRKHPFEH